MVNSSRMLSILGELVVVGESHCRSVYKASGPEARVKAIGLEFDQVGLNQGSC